MSHSRLPWKIDEWDEDSPEHLKEYNLVGNGYMDVAYVTGEVIDKVDKSQISANAAFIVKAVNNHYKLLEALKDLVAVTANPHTCWSDVQEEVSKGIKAIKESENE